MQKNLERNIYLKKSVDCTGRFKIIVTNWLDIITLSFTITFGNLYFFTFGSKYFKIPMKIYMPKVILALHYQGQILITIL